MNKVEVWRSKAKSWVVQIRIDRVDISNSTLNLFQKFSCITEQFSAFFKNWQRSKLREVKSHERTQSVTFRRESFLTQLCVACRNGNVEPAHNCARCVGTCINWRNRWDIYRSMRFSQLFLVLSDNFNCSFGHCSWVCRVCWKLCLPENFSL